ncbi:hypothetical protein I79_011497 [Cricetulus griseus]|uniref:Uncharacterized protein n=1 Tax=Cricetulus griseus TaxID=10029 RepID=G3HLB1_CRIGR|nr:hypothetical protein I79_011497 [Cricetulus griseus]
MGCELLLTILMAGACSYIYKSSSAPRDKQTKTHQHLRLPHGKSLAHPMKPNKAAAQSLMEGYLSSLYPQMYLPSTISLSSYLLSNLE